MKIEGKACNSCPRKCCADRNKQPGFCGEKNEIRIAKIINNFMWEEPCLSRDKGVLAIFFSGCNLRCDYCQNHEISRGGIGKSYSVDEFCELIERAQSSCDAIDLITPTHFSDALCSTFEKIDKKVPVIWNSSSFESVEKIEKVSKFVDIFLADFKYSDDELGRKFSQCQNYFSVALPAIKKMCEMKEDVFENETMKQGVLLRHLVLPGYVQNSLRVLDMIKDNFGDRKVSLMSQFTPNGKSSLNRKLTVLEYKTVVHHMEKLGLENGYIQDFDSASGEFVPDFV